MWGLGEEAGWSGVLSEFRELILCLILSNKAVALSLSLLSVLGGHSLGNVHSHPDLRDECDFIFQTASQESSLGQSRLIFS